MLNHIQVKSDSFVSQWTVTHQLLCPWNFPGKNTGVDCHFLLQVIFPTQQSNPCLLHWQADSLPLHHLRSPCAIPYGMACPLISPFSAKCILLPLLRLGSGSGPEVTSTLHDSPPPQLIGSAWINSACLS